MTNTGGAPRWAGYGACHTLILSKKIFNTSMHRSCTSTLAENMLLSLLTGRAASDCDLMGQQATEPQRPEASSERAAATSRTQSTRPEATALFYPHPRGHAHPNPKLARRRRLARSPGAGGAGNNGQGRPRRRLSRGLEEGGTAAASGSGALGASGSGALGRWVQAASPAGVKKIQVQESQVPFETL